MKIHNSLGTPACQDYFFGGFRWDFRTELFCFDGGYFGPGTLR